MMHIFPVISERFGWSRSLISYYL